MKTLKEKLDFYKNQREQARELYIESVGSIKAMEFAIECLMKDKNKK